MSIPQVRALPVSTAILLTAAGTYLAVFSAHPQPAQAQTVSAQARPQAAAPQLTPFEKSPFIFSSPQEAIRALDSPDILMRRSGVEWLGRWTYTYTTYGIAPDKAACTQLQSLTGIVPGLTRAVHEMPKDDSRQAARLLAVIGPQAKSAIPTVCAALASPVYGDGKPQDGDDFVARDDLLNSLTQLCGGNDNIAVELVLFMQVKDPKARRAAAAAVQYCDNPPQWRAKFREQVLPTLAACVDDPVVTVRLAALTSLEALTYASGNAPWQATEPALARGIASTDPAVRLAALKVLAYAPADVSPLIHSLRSSLHGTKEEQSYALAALSHAAETNRTETLNAFLPGLSSSNLVERKQAAADIRRIVMPLWNGSFFPDEYPLPRWYEDDRLFVSPGLSEMTPTQRDEEEQRRQMAQESAKPRILAALVHACSDPDTAVRTDAAASLDLIGQWAETMSSHGHLFAPKVKSELTVSQALFQASTALQPTDPARAKHFQKMSQGLWERQPWF